MNKTANFMAGEMKVFFILLFLLSVGNMCCVIVKHNNTLKPWILSAKVLSCLVFIHLKQ